MGEKHAILIAVEQKHLRVRSFILTFSSIYDNFAA